MKPESLSAVLERSVARFSDRTCTNFLGRKTSYAEIGAHVDRAAKGLKSLSVGKGTKVGLLLPNCPAFVVFYFGILKTGATVVNCNPLYTTQELDHQITDSETEILVTLDLAVLFDKASAHPL